MKRRDFLKAMGVISGSVLVSCDVKKTPEKLIPYLVPPEDGIVPGVAHFIRTTCTECPAKCGIMAKIMDDRPVKLEGNPNHPDNAGALCSRGQASLERLYHPHRLKAPMMRNESGRLYRVTWQEAFTAIRDQLEESKKSAAKNIFLSNLKDGALNGLIDEFCQKNAITRSGSYELIRYENLRAAYKLLFAKNSLPDFSIANTDFLLTVGADILDTFANPVKCAREFSAAKKNGLTWFHAEPHQTITGARSDVKLRLQPGSEATLLAYLIEHVPAKVKIPQGIQKLIPRVALKTVVEVTGLPEEKIKALTQKMSSASHPMVIVGGVATEHPNGLGAAFLGGVLQYALGNINRDIRFQSHRPFENVLSTNELAKIAESFEAGHVGVLIVSGISEIKEAVLSDSMMNKAAFKVAITDFVTPMMDDFDVVLPVSHSLESWGDAQSLSGVPSVIQPAIKPLHDNKPEGDIYLGLLGSSQSWQRYLATHWRPYGENFISRGVAESVGLDRAYIRASVKLNFPLVVEPDQGTTLVIMPSIRTYDGRSSRLALANEVPDPITTVSYGKFVIIPEKFAEKQNVKTGDVLSVQYSGGSLEAPAKVQPGQADQVMAIHVDKVDGELPSTEGFTTWLVPNVKVEQTGRFEAVPVLSGGMEEGRQRGITAPVEHHGPGGHEDHGEKDDHHENAAGAVIIKKDERFTLYPEHEHKDYRWAMAIDTSVCSGCNACVTACYVENNIPITGREEHLRGREMSWIRIQPYYDEADKPTFLPMMCQQCDHAPCENVCPVYATYHNPEGLNAQIYNRCVGTRYCANNCPYKARRFNWFDGRKNKVGTLSLMFNPEVSQRPAGVMEKCNFCVQRIRKAKDMAKDENRKLRDGDVIPACAQVCPPQAITFGNILDQQSNVYKKAHSANSYRVLEEVGTEPAVYYLKEGKTNES